MTRDWLMGPTFFTILNEMWTDILRFCTAGGGGGFTPQHPPNVCPWCEGG